MRARQEALRYDTMRDQNGNRLNQAHRREFLLSGLLACGCCGGGYTIMGKDRYGCATRRSKGTCDNPITVTRQQIEARVLGGLKNRLLAPERVAEFVKTFADETARVQREAAGIRGQLEHQLADVERRLEGVLRAIESGKPSHAARQTRGTPKEAANRDRGGRRSSSPGAIASERGGNLPRQGGGVRGGAERPGDQGGSFGSTARTDRTHRAHSGCRCSTRAAGGAIWRSRNDFAARQCAAAAESWKHKTPRNRCSGESIIGGCGGTQPLIPNSHSLARSSLGPRYACRASNRRVVSTGSAADKRRSHSAFARLRMPGLSRRVHPSSATPTAERAALSCSRRRSISSIPNPSVGATRLTSGSHFRRSAT
ncbi:MAG: zinc ribbon domain-containing protein [Acetobacteraceae bacterium]|nr:zinc ribbon domain-containing protein [Acetobacteraceae bacterium]